MKFSTVRIIEIFGGIALSLLLAGCATTNPVASEDLSSEDGLTQSATSWLPCPDAEWAVEGKDHRGSLIVAMCGGDGIGTYSNGEKQERWAIGERRSFGADATNTNRDRISIIDARLDHAFTISSQEYTARHLPVTKRHPDNSCGATESMRQGLRAAELDHFAEAETLTGVCIDGWVRLRAPGTDQDAPVDAALLMRPSGGGWHFYTGFPTTICTSEYRGAGGPQAFEFPFPNC